MKIYLIRHAQDGDFSLSDLGKRQASALANFLKEKGFQQGEVSVWHSPIRRARETAVAVITSLGSAVSSTCPLEWLSDDSRRAGPPLQSAIEDFLLVPGLKGIIVVTHEPTLNGILEYFADRLGYDRSLKNLRLDNCTTIVLDSESRSVEQVFRPIL